MRAAAFLRLIHAAFIHKNNLNGFENRYGAILFTGGHMIGQQLRNHVKHCTTDSNLAFSLCRRMNNSAAYYVP